MSSTPSEASAATAEDALKRRLLNRIAIAAVMVVGLLGSLAIFDAIYTPARRPEKMAELPAEPPVTEAASPAVSKLPEAATVESGALSAAMAAALSGATAVLPTPLAGLSGASGSPAATAPPVAATTTTPPAAPAAPSVAKTPFGKTENRVIAEGTTSTGAPALPPLPREKGLTKPATSRPVAIRPSEPVAPAQSLAARPDPGRTIARSPRVASAASLPGVPPRAPASRPISRIGEAQFALQMGVFTNLANAEDLRAKLELHGIPSTIEARVHVGPFASREEADAAREKLKELGLESGVLITMKK